MPTDGMTSAGRSGDWHVGPAPLDGSASIDVEEAYLELGPAVLGYLRSQSVDDAEDVLGEIFVQVVRDLGSFRGSTADFRRWVFTIAHNRMIDQVRRRKRRPLSVELRPDHECVDPSDTQSSLSDPELVAALRTLTDDQRQVLVLRFVADLKIHEVARIMHRRPGAVKALQQRALSNLTRQLER